MTKTIKSKSRKQRQTKPVNGPIRSRVALPAAAGSTLMPAQFSASTIGDGVIRLRGHELLGEVDFSLGSGDNRIAGIYDVNPACWVNSRLSRVASTYEKYRYDFFRIRYHPVAGTDVSASVALYVELEAEEPIATSPVTALNHQHSVLGPIWATSTVEYRRPVHDATTYFLSNTSTGSREATTQARVAVLGDLTSHTGYISIEYDVVFMYPELELNYAGEQYQHADGSATTPTINTPVVLGTPPSSSGVKLVELILTKDLPEAVYSFSANNAYNFTRGMKLYSAWDGNNWTVFESLASAMSLDNFLKWSATSGSSFTGSYFVRKLLKT
nr:structural protein [Tolivirales sp.]